MAPISRAARLVGPLDAADLPGVGGTSAFPLPPKLSVILFHGGRGFSVTSNRCDLNVDIRTTPAFDAHDAGTRVRKAVAELDAELPAPKPTGVTPIATWPPFRLSEGEEPAAEAGLMVRARTAGPSNIGNLLAGEGIAATAGRRRFVCGDLAGHRAVYYTLRGNAETAWETEAGLLGRPLVPDLPRLAAWLMVCEHHWPHRSPYEEIRLVPGGFGLLLAPGAPPQLGDVCGIEPVDEPREGAERFGQVLTEAFQHRVRVAGAGVWNGPSMRWSSVMKVRTASPTTTNTTARETAGRTSSAVRPRHAVSFRATGPGTRSLTNLCGTPAPGCH